MNRAGTSACPGCAATPAEPIVGAGRVGIADCRSCLARLWSLALPVGVLYWRCDRTGTPGFIDAAGRTDPDNPLVKLAERLDAGVDGGAFEAAGVTGADSLDTVELVMELEDEFAR